MSNMSWAIANKIPTTFTTKYSPAAVGWNA